MQNLLSGRARAVHWAAALILAALLCLPIVLAGSAAPAAGGEPRAAITPTPRPFPPVLMVFMDKFDTPSTYATYTAFGGASVSIGGGKLHVAVPPGTPPDTAGLRMRLPPNGRGVRCAAFMGLDLPVLGGNQMHWTLFGFDEVTGLETVWLELFVEELPSATAAKAETLRVYTKKNGDLVWAEVETNKTAADIDKIQWDSKDGGKKIQLEIKFKDGSKKSSGWVDPDPGTIAGFDAATDAEGFSVDATGGTEVHAQTEVPMGEPAPILAFDSQALNDEEPHWLIQTHDADAVVVATVYRIGGVVPRTVEGDSRPRLRVEYQLREELFGALEEPWFVVYHALERPEDLDRFRHGSRQILFLKRNPQTQGRLWFWDFGSPTGVVPHSRPNLKAVISRVTFIHGENVP